ncbi:MAG: hypothetical protein ABIZ49_10940 [Opitutaceae bacterium]
MKARVLIALAAGLAVIAPALRSAAKADIDPLPKRQQTVDTALRLTRAPAPGPLPANFVSLFNPPNFDQPDAVAADPRAAAPGAAAPAPMGPRELLDTIAARIPPTGTMTNLAGETLLTFGTKKVRRGDIIGVEYNGQTHDLELVAIDRTTFTLRYRGEEITRPIKPSK